MTTHTPGRFGVFYRTGHWEHTIAFRIDDPMAIGSKKIVCGCCVAISETGDSRTTGGSFLCEECSQPLGRSESHDAAIAKTTGAA